MIDDEELVRRFRGFNVTHDNKAHFRGRLERRLMLARCASCGVWQHTQRPMCAACWSPDITPAEVSGEGVIHLLILLHQGPPAPGVSFNPPHPVATIELDEQKGLRFTSTIIGAENDDIAIGKRVELAWIERNEAPFPVFKLSGEQRA